MKILIAEDDDLSRSLLGGILTADGHTVHAANDGTAAWAALNEQQGFDLAILDVMMPGLSGMEVLARVRGDRKLARLPVILCTALSDRATVTSAAALEINHYIVKPFSRSVVLDKVRRVAAEQTKSEALEPADVVCGRLGLDRPVWQLMLNRLADTVSAWLGELQQVLNQEQLKPLALRANAMAGACINLGAPTLAAQLSAAEVALSSAASGSGAQAEGAISDPTLLAKITSLVENVEREHKRFRQAVASAAPKPTA